MRLAREAGTLSALLVIAGCRPESEDDYWRVDTVRVLAVKSEPAEARPGTTVTFTALLSALADPGETPVWRFCTAPKPLTENNAVSVACLSSSSLVAAGTGVAIEAPTPSNGCTLFGPNSPPGGFRPRDPDITGGYYQPLRIDLDGAEPTFHLQRIACDLAEAASDTATEFGLSYAPNQNPRLNPLAARIAGASIALPQIPAGAHVDLTLSWPASDAERYTYYDRDQQILIDQREAMRVSWFVDAGQLDTQANGRGESDSQSSVSNRWTAPGSPGTATLWAVLRDSRGGVDFAAYALDVQ